MTRKKIITTLCVMLASTSSYAISDNEYAKCAVVKGDLSRLECFDNLAASNQLNGRQSQPTNIDGDVGKWLVSIDANPIDDSKTVSLLLSADSGKNKWGKQVYLVIQCKSNTTNLYIGWNDYLGSKARVLTRIGDNKAVKSNWSLSTDSQATFRRKPIAFVTEMLEADKLLAQVTPYNESPVTAIFDTSGLINAITPLRETCNW